MTKLAVAFRNSANAPKKYYYRSQRFKNWTSKYILRNLVLRSAHTKTCWTSLYYNTVQSGKYISRFQSNLLPPSLSAPPKRRYISTWLYVKFHHSHRRGNPKSQFLKYSETNLSHCHSVHHVPYMDWPGSNPGLWGEMEAINRLIHGTDQISK